MRNRRPLIKFSSSRRIMAIPRLISLLLLFLAASSTISAQPNPDPKGKGKGPGPIPIPGPFPHPGMNPGFYSETCPRVEHIVRRGIDLAFEESPRIAPLLLRLFFHDCIVRGCDASVLLDGADAEKTAIPNLTLGGLDVIDTLKAVLERECPGVVSCSDILAMATREAIRKVGAPVFPLRLGRRDGMTSLASEALSLTPSPFQKTSEIVARFKQVGLDANDLVALSGAHSIGQGHCAFVANRLPPNKDDTIDPTYAAQLATKCASQTSQPLNGSIPNDPMTPDVFDHKYYKNLKAKKGLFLSDQDLFNDPTTKPAVNTFASLRTPFFNEFARAMSKLSEVGILTGTAGEVRRNCRFTNANNPAQPILEKSTLLCSLAPDMCAAK